MKYSCSWILSDCCGSAVLEVGGKNEERKLLCVEKYEKEWTSTSPSWLIHTIPFTAQKGLESNGNDNREKSCR